MMASDKEDLKNNKFVRIDSQKNELVEYKLVFNQFVVQNKVDVRDISAHVLKVQCAWRAHQAREYVKKIKSDKANELAQIGNQTNKLGKG